MPSPDVAGYTGLTLLDVTAQQMIDTAIARLAESWPDWQPREGNTEVVLLERLAEVAENIIYAINRLPDGMTEVLLRLAQMERSMGTPATGTVEFAVADTAGHSIPAGTTVRALVDGQDPVDFTTDSVVGIPVGETTGTVTVTATVNGTAGNGHPPGRVLELVDAVPFVETVTVTALTGGGTGPEDAEAFLSRGVTRLARLTSTVVRPADVERFVAEQVVARRVKCLDLYDPAAAGSPGAHPGNVTVAVATTGGGALSASAKASLLASLQDAMHAGLKVHVVDATVTPVNVAVTVLRLPGTSAAAVQAAVTAQLQEYLSPDTWDWSKTVRVNELIAQADRAAGVDVVLAVTSPAADLTLPGVAPLAAAGTITVTVQEP